MKIEKYSGMGKSTIDVEATAFSGGKESRDVREIVTVEEPLEIRLCTEKKSEYRTISVTMRTPGMDIQLAAGFLFTEGIVGQREEILSIEFTEDGSANRENVVEVRVSDDVYRSSSSYLRNFATNSSCGVCGKSSINDIFVKGRKVLRSNLRVPASVILDLPATMRNSQSIFSKTGGIHAAAVFDATGRLISIAEDVGRHNAVDKVVGDLLMRDLIPATDSIIQISGRAGFEMVQKSIMGGIPVICSVSAPSSLAVETARTFNATLVCFVRDGRFNIYSHGGRIITD